MEIQDRRNENPGKMMGRSSKPRKAYKPQHNGELPIIYALPSEIKTELAIAPLMAINMFLNGNGSEEHAYAIISTILTAYELADNEVDFEILINGINAMRRVIKRGSYGKWGLSGDDMNDIKSSVTLSDQLQSVATRRKLRSALYAALNNQHI